MKIKRNDADVLYCGTLVAEGLTTLEIEEYFGIPHSTTHWLIIHKLQNLDIDLWDKCLLVFNQHKHSSKRSKA